MSEEQKNINLGFLFNTIIDCVEEPTWRNLVYKFFSSAESRINVLHPGYKSPEWNLFSDILAERLKRDK